MHGRLVEAYGRFYAVFFSTNIKLSLRMFFCFFSFISLLSLGIFRNSPRDRLQVGLIVQLQLATENTQCGIGSNVVQA